MIYEATCKQCGNVEIEKPMTAPFPVRHTCGAQLSRRYSPIAVHYAAPGFYSSDVTRFRSQVGAERFAKFEREREDVLKRTKQGKLTPNEKRLIELDHANV